MLSTISMLSMQSFVADASNLQVTSSAFSDHAPIPTRFTCSGADVSPPLSWSDVPDGTKSLALILDDPDAPSGTFVHWVVYDVHPTVDGFKEGEVEGVQGANSMRKAAYMGPCPPPGSPHHYHFRLFALDTLLNLEDAPSAQQLRDAMQGHIKQSAELVGTFGR
ncbi:MAG TPA: YbhB/YbcL family Raf kinase inhibitor-like protein [Candidatus Binataceae bacterium]|nr:YbhB/YbcL family Raf kinase inhibitor-like protein [Candidatus Binataceae bacterium]